MKFLKTGLLVFLTIAIGVGVAIYRIADFEHSSAFFHNGGWMGSNKLSLGKDPLLTAQITVFALFALPSEEAIYLFAKRDEELQKLDAKNEYLLSGNVHQLKAKYWSITAYGKDLFLIPNQANRYSFSLSNLQTDSAGNFTIHIAYTQRNGNWLPAPKEGTFSLVLRIYKGEKTFVDSLSTTALPTINRIKG